MRNVHVHVHVICVTRVTGVAVAVFAPERVVGRPTCSLGYPTGWKRETGRTRSIRPSDEGHEGQYRMRELNANDVVSDGDFRPFPIRSAGPGIRVLHEKKQRFYPQNMGGSSPVLGMDNEKFI